MSSIGSQLCSLMCLTMMGVSARADDSVQLTRTNPLLLDYFRERLTGIYAHQGPRGRRQAALNARSLNQYALALAEDYLSQVTERLIALRDGFENVRRARAEAVHGSMGFKSEVQAAWSASLKEVSDEARHLHGMLSLLFDGVDPKGASAPEIDRRGLESGFKEETELMGAQIQRLDQRIRGFLAGETFSISVEELRDEDMLMLLSRVQTEAKEMRWILDASSQLGAESAKRTDDRRESGSNSLVIFPSRRIEPW